MMVFTVHDNKKKLDTRNKGGGVGWGVVLNFQQTTRVKEKNLARGKLKDLQNNTNAKHRCMRVAGNVDIIRPFEIDANYS